MPDMASSSSGRLAWITGAGGLIGSYLVKSKATGPWKPRPLTRSQLDLLDFHAVQTLYRAEQPTLVMHCAALSKSPACQADPVLAQRLNVDITKLLAELAHDIPLIFLSTDLVFDGLKGGYVEQDAVNPLSVYAETKAAAEQVVLRNPRHTVVRTSLNGGTSPTGDRGFNEEMRAAWQAGKVLNLFTDEFRCPIPAVVTATALWSVAEAQRPGMYHLAGAQRLSRWEIGQLLAQRWPRLQPKIQPGSLRDYKGAPRSPDTTLNSSKVQALLPQRLPGLGEWLSTHPDEVF